MQWITRNLSQIFILFVLAAITLKLIHNSSPENAKSALGIAAVGIPASLMYLLWHGWQMMTGAITVERVGDRLVFTNHGFFFTLSCFAFKLAISTCLAAFALMWFNIIPNMGQ